MKRMARCGAFTIRRSLRISEEDVIQFVMILTAYRRPTEKGSYREISTWVCVGALQHEYCHSSIVNINMPRLRLFSGEDSYTGYWEITDVHFISKSIKVFIVLYNPTNCYRIITARILYSWDCSSSIKNNSQAKGRQGGCLDNQC